MVNLNKFKESLINSDTINLDGYTYVINGVCDGIPFIDSSVLLEISLFILEKYDLSGVDKIVCVEAMGIPIASILSLISGIPFVVIRKKSYHLDDEIIVHSSTGYSENKLYINNIHNKDTIFLIDDIISTGGTLTNILNTLLKNGVVIKKAVCLVGKNNGKNIVFEKTGVTVDTLVDLYLDDESNISVEIN